MQTAQLTAWRNGLLNELLLVFPTETTWEEALLQAEARLEETKSSLPGRGAQLTLDLGSRIIPFEELEALIDRIESRFSLLVVAVIATDMGTQEAARRLCRSAYLMLPGSTTAGFDSRDSAGNNALYVGGTVRSGQRIVHGGTVVVGGDVNAGAEVVARGDILIFGVLRGLAHAGCEGDEEASIRAGAMRPQQLRIAAAIARPPEEDSRTNSHDRHPEMARIENGSIQVFPA